MKRSVIRKREHLGLSAAWAYQIKIHAISPPYHRPKPNPNRDIILPRTYNSDAPGVYAELLLVAN